MNRPVLHWRIKLGPLHQPTGKTRHFSTSGLLPPPSELQIVKFADQPGFFLLYCDSNGQDFTDTWHESLESAIRQADWEFEVKPNEWETVRSQDHDPSANH